MIKLNGLSGSPQFFFKFYLQPLNSAANPKKSINKTPNNDQQKIWEHQKKDMQLV